MKTDVQDWTDQQRGAIEDRRNDLIVTAAAGSGKTAVLTERVVRLITEAAPGEALPASLEDLLVVTFTVKAARDMRRRIEQRILRGLETEPENARLRAALDALPRASIMTLHAFCDRLVRKHFDAAGVSPGARIADDDETTEIAGQATRQCFEQMARPGDPNAEGFALLVATTEPHGGEGGVLGSLARRVAFLSQFLASLEDPEDWQRGVRTECEGALEADRYDDLGQASSASLALAQSLLDLAESFEEILDRARAKTGDASEPTLSRWSSFAAEMKAFAKDLSDQPGSMLSAHVARLIEWTEGSSGASLGKLGNKAVCGAEIFKDKAFVTHALKPFAGRFTRWRDQWLTLDAGHWLAAAQMAARQCLALLDVAGRVERTAQEIKRRRGVMSFADLERKAYGVLSGPDGIGPSDLAETYHQIYRAVLVDEYQDISPLQDAIIRRLSQGDDPSVEARGGFFAVGDVKQSIYRFRRADPSLFRGRLERSSAEPDPADGRRRISLAANFRSQPGILRCVNAVFGRLMDRALGGIEYDEEARLREGREAEGEPVCVEVHWIDKDASVAPDSTSDSRRDPARAASSRGAEQAEGGESETEGEEIALSSLQREATWIADRIKRMTSPEDGVWIPDESSAQGRRRARPADCAILVRKLSADAPVWVSVFERAGLRIRTTGGDSLLSEPEIADLINALRLAENPFQDVALAAVLRSPIAALNETEMLTLRMARRGGAFHDAVWAAAGRLGDGVSAKGDSASQSTDPPGPGAPIRAALGEKLDKFLKRLDRWRLLAARAEPESVLRAILADTHYRSFLLGRPEPDELLGQLGELNRRLRSSSGGAGGASGLSNFLRLIDENPDRADPNRDEAPSGDDGAATLLTIHRAKGLEFPIVFLARTGSRFNTRDASNDLILDPHEGMAMAGIDPERRLKLRSPGVLALRAGAERASRAEELRLLYVAMTRARERLVIVGSVGLKNLDDRWDHSPLARGDEVAPVLERLKAGSPADLLGPLLRRFARQDDPPWLRIETHASLPRPAAHADLPAIREVLKLQGEGEALRRAQEEFAQVFGEESEEEPIGSADENGDGVSVGAWAGGPVRLLLHSEHRAGLRGRPLKCRAGQITRDDKGRLVIRQTSHDSAESSRVRDESLDETGPIDLSDFTSRIPRFAKAAGAEGLPGAARGSLVHTFLRHVDFRGGLDRAGLAAQAEELFGRGFLDVEDASALDAIPYDKIEWFFQSPLGERIRERPGAMRREMPFSLLMSEDEFHWPRSGRDDEPASDGLGRMILVRGVIDCLVDGGDNVLLIDYKTDRARPGDKDAIARLKARYATQIEIYRRALKGLWDAPIVEAHLVFLEAEHNEFVEDSAN